MNQRTEKDSLGKKKLPKESYYGIHTQRALENIQISNRTLDPELFYAIAEIKEASTKTNLQLNLLRKSEAHAIIKACQEIQKGKFDYDFLVDIFQTSTGAEAHMNVNEVIANRAIEFLQGKKGDYSLIDPIDHINPEQDDTDVFSNAIKIATVKKLYSLNYELTSLQRSFLLKSKQFKKSKRTNLNLPVTNLAKEFHNHSTTIKKDLERLDGTMSSLLHLNIGKNTGLNTYLDFRKKTISNLKKINNVPWKQAHNQIETTQTTTDFLETAEILKTISANLIRITNNINLLQPNPEIVGILNIVCSQVIGYEEAIATSAQINQLNIALPLIAHNLLESTEILTNSINLFNEKCIKTLKPTKNIYEYHLKNQKDQGTLSNRYRRFEKTDLDRVLKYRQLTKT